MTFLSELTDINVSNLDKLVFKLADVSEFLVFNII
jgi:hypothetical protein